MSATAPAGENLARIPVAYLIVGLENNRNALINFFRNAQAQLNLVIDGAHLGTTSKNVWLWQEISKARMRGVRVRSITEITKENIAASKLDRARVDEMRHLAGIRTVFGVSDTEFIAMAPLPISVNMDERVQFIQSDSETVVEYKQLIFDTLWARANPALARIRALEGKSDGKSYVDLEGDVIDRIYTCLQCNKTFIFSLEVNEHKRTTGHDTYREYSLI